MRAQSGDSANASVVGVIPDVAGLEAVFDYAFPEKLGEPFVGMRVRAPLHGRSVAGWISELDTTPPEDKTLREITKVSGWGPSRDVIELARWAAWRWSARTNTFLQTASPQRNVYQLSQQNESRDEDGQQRLDNFSVTTHRWPPTSDPYELIVDAIDNGPALIIVPSLRQSERLHTRLRKNGHKVALSPGDWGVARSGNISVVGTMSAAWAPVHPLRRIVVVDCHDRALRQEGAPTWDAVEVAVERARRCGAAVTLLSPAPRLEHLAFSQLVEPAKEEERRGWANIEVVDMRDEDPRNGLFSEAVTRAIGQQARVLCVLNRKGRATLLVCNKCQSIPACSRCEGRVTVTTAESIELSCTRCDFAQPVVCSKCGGTKFKQLRLGVNQAAEQLAKVINKPVGEVTQESDSLPDTQVLLGTEAVLNRVGRADLVVFLDFDQDLFAQKFRADEDALLLLARASRIVRGKPARVIVQTRKPDHVALTAAASVQPQLVNEASIAFRQVMQWPPFGAIATVTGPNAQAFVDAAPLGIEVWGPDNGTFMLKARSTEVLCNGLAEMRRPQGRLAVRVDPYGV